ncbi:DUF3467 domain-containing protein [Microbacterium sp. SS28]|uniref:DUF3467 domain-containing protein n=1 Tax=Microbacterium sp. SS28 TaxID=2919948 RepID=UPI001FAB0D44|nr:DUF3467 domain-containing protein [Microbacterium sp. SS28]
MTDEATPAQIQFDVNLPSENETGVFADFANIWHTPNTFVLDFLSVKGPAVQTGDAEVARLPVKVAARVRIPPEQIFPLIEALTQQGQRWLRETGRSAPPENWAGQGMPD